MMNVITAVLLTLIVIPTFDIKLGGLQTVVTCVSVAFVVSVLEKHSGNDK